MKVGLKICSEVRRTTSEPKLMLILAPLWVDVKWVLKETRDPERIQRGLHLFISPVIDRPYHSSKTVFEIGTVEANFPRVFAPRGRMLDAERLDPLREE